MMNPNPSTFPRAISDHGCMTIKTPSKCKDSREGGEQQSRCVKTARRGRGAHTHAFRWPYASTLDAASSEYASDRGAKWRTRTPLQQQQAMSSWNAGNGSGVSGKTFLLTLMVSNLLVLQLCQLQQMSPRVQQQESPAVPPLSFSSLSFLSSSSASERAFDQDNTYDDNGHEDDYWLAKEQSFGFFTDISKADWKRYYQHRHRHDDSANNTKNMTNYYYSYRFPNDPNFRSHDVAYWTFFNWDANHFSCPHLVRFVASRSTSTAAATAGSSGTTDYTPATTNSIKAICDPERILHQIHERRLRLRPGQQQQQQESEAKSSTGKNNSTTSSFHDPNQPSNTRRSTESHCLIYSFGSSTSAASYTTNSSSRSIQLDRFQEQHGWIENLLEYWAADTATTTNDDYTFCEIHIFDPFLRATTTKNSTPNSNSHHQQLLLTRPNVFVHSWKLVSSSLLERRKRTTMDADSLFSFDEIVTQLGHVHRVVDILHLACDGCEWYSYRDWLLWPNSSGKKKIDIRQVLVQTYSLPAALVAARMPELVASHHQQQLPEEEEEETQYDRYLQSMNASDFFDAFRQVNYALYAKQVNSGYPSIDQGKNCLRTEWSFIKLHADFFPAPRDKHD